MSSINKGFELEKRDIRNEVVKILNVTWLPHSTQAEIMAGLQQELIILAQKDLKVQEIEHQDALKEEQEEAKNEEEKVGEE